MTERLKNVALEPATHRALKLLCAENDWTMTKAVEYLLNRMHQEGGQGNVGAGSDQPVSGSRKAKRREPHATDRDRAE